MIPSQETALISNARTLIDGLRFLASHDRVAASRVYAAIIDELVALRQPASLSERVEGDR